MEGSRWGMYISRNSRYVKFVTTFSTKSELFIMVSMEIQNTKNKEAKV